MRIFKILAVIAVGVSVVSCGNQRPSVKSLETEVDSASYALGMDMAIKVGKNFEESNAEAYVQGYLDIKDSADLLIDREEMDAVLQAFFSKRQRAIMEKRQKEEIEKATKKFGDNKEASEKFLAENKTKEGVKTTESGLQYKVLKEGKGETPVISSKIKIYYEGKLVDGTVFDATEKGNPTVAFTNQFVKGFSEGLMLMKEGAKYRFFIPSELAYQHKSRGKDIKPFSTLIFDVELLELVKD